LQLFLVFGAESVNPLLPATPELIWGLLAFGILFFFLRKAVFPNIQGIFEQRTKNIEDALNEAESNRQEAQRLLDDYKEQLSGAREEARRIVDEAKEAAEHARRDIINKSESDAENILERAQREIESQRRAAFAELRQEVGELAVAVAGRIVHEELDEDRQLRLVDDYIDELTSSNGGSSAAG
jgi:F-type H+-transporting ATPase subunit b